MRSKKLWKRIGIAVLIGLGAAAVVGFVVIAQRWSQPLTEGANLPTFAPTKTGIVEVRGMEEDGVEESAAVERATDALAGIEIAPTATPVPVGQPTPAPLCGGPAVMMILGIGIDTEDPEYYYGLGDVIRIVRVDFVTPKVSVLSLPRDIWVEIPGISDHYGITHGKLNQAYLFGTKGMGYYDGPGEGAGLMALTLVENFELYVDRYGVGNMAAVAKVIDAVGGIDIVLEGGVDARPAKLGYLAAGTHHFTGDKAVAFSRLRKYDGDLYRINRQSQVLYALLDKIRSPEVLPRIPKLISSFEDVVITDLSPSDINRLLCLVPHINSENLIFTSLPGNLLQEDRQWDPHREVDTWVFRADFEAIRRLLKFFQNGNWPMN